MTYTSKAKGINAALDLVEEALISLQEKAKNQPSTSQSNTSSQLIRTCPQASASDLSQNPTSRNVKTTGVLIRRSSRSRSENLKTADNKTKNIKRTKSKKKYGAPFEVVENHPNKKGQQASQQNLSTSSEGTPRKARRHPRYRPRKEKENDENTPHESTRYSEIECPSHRYSRRQKDKDIYKVIDTSEGESLPGRKHKSSRRSLSRSSHTKHQRKGSTSTGDSDSVTSHREPRRRNLREVHTVSNQKNTVRETNNTKNPAMKPSSSKEIKKRRHGYAEPTLTSRLRTELVEPRETEEKENLIPFIPSGTKNKSFHVGVIIQKELGKLKNIPPKELEFLMSSEKNRHDSKASTSGVTEQTVKTAMQNIQKEITAVSKRISKQ